jgi:hypothetical protein
MPRLLSVRQRGRREEERDEKERKDRVILKKEDYLLIQEKLQKKEFERDSLFTEQCEITCSFSNPG